MLMPVLIAMTILAGIATMGWVVLRWRRTEADLWSERRTVDRLREILDASEDCLLLLDGGGRILAANERVAGYWGLTPTALVGRPIADLLPDDCRDELASLMAGVVATGELARWVVSRDDHQYEVTLRSSTPDGAGAPVSRLVAAVHDITDRNRVETAVQETDAMFRAAFEQAAVGMAQVGPALCILRVNRRFRDFLAWPEDDLIGRSFAEILHGDDVGRVLEATSRLLSEPAVVGGASEDGTFSTEARCVRRDGAFVWGQMSLAVVRDSAGRPRFFLPVIKDITDRKAMEAALSQARDAAERASDAKTRFLAAASHDLRQPLQAVIMFVNVLANRITDERQRAIITKIEASLDAFRDLLNGLLDISKLEAGMVAVRRSDFPLGLVLERVVADSSSIAETSGLSLRFVSCPWLVHSDPALVERLIRNLVTNAIRYTEHGRILVGCRRHGDTVRVQVWDTGIGIPEDKQEAIFQEFYQVGNEARDRRKGLGLGLAVVERLSRLLGHPVRLRSVVGRGSMFEVELPIVGLPRCDRDPPAGPLAVAAVAAVVAVAAPGGGGRIVVIDDDPDVLFAMRLALEEGGFRVVAAATADEALSQIVDGCPDAIIADYRLHNGATGSEAILHMQQVLGRAVPGILVTGDTSPERLNEARASGFEILHKPVRAEDLRAAVFDHLRGPA